MLNVKRTLTAIGVFAAVAVAAFAATGGPDTYGYRYFDSDAPDTAAYRWVDTTGPGWVTVTGLSDDNAVGPFPIGFNFPYYWYSVNQFWVHSNGGISFSMPSYPWTPQNPGDNGFPNIVLPQNLVGVLGFDFDFDAGGVCRYRSRTTAPESLIVTWLNALRWGTIDSFSFQVVLTRQDSCLRFMYQTITNLPAKTGSIGIENLSGIIGLEYYNNGRPPGNNPHAGLAVKFKPPATSTYTAIDAGVVWAQNQTSSAATLHTGDSLKPQAKVRNCGTTTLTNLMVICRIRNGAALVFADTVTIASLAKAQEQQIAFARSFKPLTAASYTMVVRTMAVENPVNATNDSLIFELPVVTYPAWITYDDNLRDAWVKWKGTSPATPTGVANRYQLSRLPVIVDSARIYIDHTLGDQVYVEVYDTTGSTGGPGALLAADTLVFATNASEWVTVDFTAATILSNNGKFYIAARTPSTKVQFGIDRTGPFSRSGYEYINRWALFRALESQEIMIRTYVHYPAQPAFYVDAAAGSDFNPGTALLPFRTVGRALSMIALVPATDTCYIRNGTYAEQVDILPAHSGTGANRTVIAAYPGHAPQIKPSGPPYALADSAGNYVTIRGLAIYPGAQQMTAVIFNGSNVDFRDNTVYAPTMGPALLVMNQNSTMIKGNIIQPIADNAYPAEGIWLYGATGARIDSNQITSMIDAGILLNYSTNITVCRNVVDHCFYGIDANSSAADSIYNNVFDQNANSGIHIQDLSGTLTARNNNITNNVYGFCWADSQGTVSSNYNNVWNNTYNYKNPQGPGDTNVVAAGANDKSLSPLYAAGYHLQAGSPCINAGMNVGLPFLGPAPDIGAFEDWAKTLTGAGGSGSAPASYRLRQNLPNPFGRITNIQYQITKPGPVSLKLYNIAGQAVRTLAHCFQAPGVYSVNWDGRDDSGRPVGAGVYYYRLVTADYQQARSLLYLK